MKSLIRLILSAIPVLALVVAAYAAQVSIGPADDPYVVDSDFKSRIVSYPERIVATGTRIGSLPVDTVQIAQLDCSLFPFICAYVEVLDASGNPMGGMNSDSFCVSQDGTPITTYTVEELTLDSCITSVALVIDVSGSMGSEGKLNAVKSAARTFIRSMDDYDRVAVVAFSDCYHVIKDFTSDTTVLISAVNGLTAQGFTAALDGIWKGVDITRWETGSKAVVALSDGMENRSQFCGDASTPDGLPDGFADDSTLICNLANASGIPIYTISLGSTFDPAYLMGLSGGTGGDYYHAPTGADVQLIYEEIKYRLCSRYLICYDSPDTVSNGEWHDVAVCYRDRLGNCGPCDTASCQEAAPPEITRTPETIQLDSICQPLYGDLEICAIVVDSSPPEVELVRLHYRLLGSGSYTQVDMDDEGGDLYCYTIPGGTVACLAEIDYYITASDGITTVSDPPVNPQTSPYVIDICDNHAPVCNLPDDNTYAICADSTFSFSISASDEDNNLVGCVMTSGDGSFDGSSWTFTATSSGTFSATFQCEDGCGATCSGTSTMTINYNSPPIAGCPGDTSLLVCNTSEACVPGFTSYDVDGNIVSRIAQGCELHHDTACFVPQEGIRSITYIVTDGCGEADTCVTLVNISINEAPVCSGPADQTIFQCTPTEVSLPVGATDADNNLSGCAVVAGPGNIVGGNWVYTPTGDQVVNVTVRCTDACGAYCEDSFVITFNMNEAPICSGPADQTIFQCTPTEVSLPVGATDADNNLSGCAVVNGPGNIVGNNWVYTPSGDEVTNVTVRCTDACGAYCEDSFVITFNMNEAPVCSGPADQTIFQCTPTEVSLPVGATDADNNLNGCSVVSGPGSIVGNNWVYTPSGDEVANVTVRCTDACGAYCEDSFVITFNMNEAPICNGPADQTIFQCTPTEVSLPVGATDADNNLNGCSVVSGPGSIVGNNWVYTPSGDEVANVTVRCTDACGAYCEDSFVITFNMNEAPICSGPADQTIFQCTPTEVSLPVGATDADNNLNGCSVVSGPGSIVGNNWVYTPSGDEVANVTVRCTDACGAYCEDSFVITFNMNEAPICSGPADQTIFQCTPTEVSLPVSAMDADNNLSGCAVVAGPGTIVGGNWVYTPTGDQVVDVTVRCSDACGAYCEDSFVITFNMNEAPICSGPADQTFFQCTPTQVSLPVSATDADNNLTGCAVVAGPGNIVGGNWVYTPSGDQVVNVTVRCTDACGAYCEDSFTITFDVNQAPICSGPADQTIFQCTPTQVSLPMSATDPDNNLTGCAVVTGPGNIVGGNWVYTPTGDQVVSVTVRCTDACGAYCEDSFVITFNMNEAPVCSVPSNQTIFQCTPTQVSLPVSATDADNNLSGCTVVSGLGSIVGGNWVYTPTGDQVVNVTVRCTDACGAYCEKSFTITFNINEAPVCSVPSNQTIFQCTPTQVSLPVGATDADNNLSGCTVVGGSGNIVGGNWIYTPSGDQVVNVTVRCTDACGAYCEKSFAITFSINEAPVCDLPDDATYFVCGDTTFNFAVTATDADNNLSGCTKVSGPGTFNGTTWSITATSSGLYSATFKCTDQCGLECSGTVNITVVENSAPVCHVPNHMTIGQCEPTEVNLQVYGTDPDNNLIGCQKVSGPGTLNGNYWKYTPSGDETVNVTVVCTDACGATCQSSFQVDFVIDEMYCTCPKVAIEKTHSTFQGHYVDVSITIEDYPLMMGGFDFLIAYDASGLVPIEITPGELLTDCGWEFFTYRCGIHANCEGPCPSGLLSIIALAEINNGPNHPDCFGPPDTDPHELATMKFYVTNDRSFDCQYVPVKFFWTECGDNAFSNVLGDILYIDARVFGFEGNVIWDEEDDLNYPESNRLPNTGAPDDCLNPDPNKPTPVRFICFKNGGVDIICADSIDARGDINLNSFAYEISDAVLYTNYFVYGLGVFDINVEGQIAASDANNDGRPLTVGDLVYLIRVLTGDALPVPKLSPFADDADLLVSRNSDVVELSSNSLVDIGAASFVFRMEDPNQPVTVALSDQAEGMKVLSGVVDGELRVLVYSHEKDKIAAGETRIVSIECDTRLDLIKCDMSDYDGNELRVNAKDAAVPSQFSLSQNFPNPFNPQTEIALSLPVATAWSVDIYNVAGQLVRRYEGSSPAGTVRLTWDGRAASGSDAASGIYFYKATAGSFTETKKMVLMK